MAKHNALFKFEPMLGPCEDYPVGSVEWAERISNRLQLATESVTRDTVHHLKTCLEQIWSAPKPPWEVWPQGRPFGTPDDYCRAVTGHSWQSLIVTVEELTGEAIEPGGLTANRMRADLARAQVEHRPQGKNHEFPSLHGNRGNNVDYLLRRIEREAPEFLDAYQRGEFTSARAAAKAAGIITEITVLDRMLKLAKKTTYEDRRKLREKFDELDEIDAMRKTGT
jgi:hypothetical protein